MSGHPSHRHRVMPFAGVLVFLATALGAPAAVPAATRPLRVVTSFLPPAVGSPYQGGTLPSVITQQAIFDSLTRLGADGKAAPGLAVSWTTADSKTWIFHLRSGVVFSNGEKLTAEAMIVGHNHMQSRAGQAETVGSYLVNVETVKAIDDLTVEITLQETDVIFPIHATVWFLVPPKLWLSLGPEKFVQVPIGSGPFVISRAQTGKIELARNPTSWRQAKSDRMTILEVKEEGSRESALLSGQADIALGISPESKEMIEQGGMHFFVRPAPLSPFAAFTLQLHPGTPMQDVRVRRAINFAVNRQAIVDRILLGATQTVGQLAAPSSFGFNSKIAPYPYDPAKAKALLAEAGFPKGFEMTIELSPLGSSDALFYQQIAADLEKVGIHAVIRTVPLSQLTTDMLTGTLFGDLFATASRTLDPLLDYRFRTCLSPNSGRKPYACNPKVLAVAVKAKTAKTVAEAEDLYRQTMQLEFDDPPGLFMWTGVNFDGLQPTVKGYAPVQDYINFDEIVVGD